MSEVELTLKQILNSKIYRDGARLAMWISPLLFAACGALLNDIRSNTVDAVAQIKQDVASVQEVQGQRASDNDRFQVSITSDVVEVKDGVNMVQEDLGQVKLDVALIRGVLQEMQRRDLAQTRLPRMQ